MVKPQLDEEAIFNVARRIESPDVRRVYLQQSCGDDEKLLARIEALLRVHEQEHGLLRTAEPSDEIDETAVTERPGALIGRYKLLEQIGEGGFGVVFMAEQQEPVRRKVALKIIKLGMDTRQVIARFEAERQALALMEHPNIAKVLDAGATDSGRPFFVMELIKGMPITEYCDQCKLAVRERLDLFIAVCQAVQHAHQKGIIHRDIKPTNVLVTQVDGVPVAKVIDFGIAKATGQQLTEKTLFTHFAQMIGTPLYMSPEQAALSGADVDTRSDIYSLGVLLYEMLTGTTPFDKERLRNAAFDEIRRIIREDEPPKPSTRVSTLGQVESTVSTMRGIEPKQLSRLLRGDLDWIVMKSLEKERNRRYESASAFAADVQRYLNDESVQAHPPSAGYRLRKFARRHKVGLAIAALLLFVTVLLGGGAGWMASQQSARRGQLDRDVSVLLDEAEKKQAELHAQLADPIKAIQLLSSIDGWQESLARARTAWRQANNLAVGNQNVLTPDLAERLRQVEENLKDDEADWHLAKTLDDIRLEAAMLSDVSNLIAAAPKYEKVFETIGPDWTAKTPAEVAARIQAMKLRFVLVAALDDWANRLTSSDLKKDIDNPIVARLLQIARFGDPDPWRDQVRDPKSWADRQALAKLAKEADAMRQSPAIILLLADRLRENDAAAFVRSALVYHPQDFWLHFIWETMSKTPTSRSVVSRLP
jgi:serine/threonine protein kinase